MKDQTIDKNGLYKRECENCGKTIITPAKRRKYCSVCGLDKSHNSPHKFFKNVVSYDL